MSSDSTAESSDIMDSNKENLIRELHRYSAQHGGRIPRRDDLRRIEGYSSKEKFYKAFGTWTNAIDAAFPDRNLPDPVVNDNDCPSTVDPEPISEPESGSRCIPSERFEEQDLEGFSSEFEVEGQAEFVKSTQLPDNDVISDSKLEAAPEKTVEEKPDKEFLINELRRFERENDRLPMLEDMKKSNGYPSKKQYNKGFKSWEKALRAAFPIKKCVYLIGNNKCYLIDEKSKYKEVHDFTKN